MWMKACSERGREALYMDVYMCLLIVQAFLLWIRIVNILQLVKYHYFCYISELITNWDIIVFVKRRKYHIFVIIFNI